MNPSNVRDIIRAHAQYIPRYQVLEDYYLGYHKILNREMSTSDKPNNKPITNYPKLIVDTKTGYFLGKPVVYKSMDKEYLEQYNEVMRDNHASDTDSELSKMAGIFGHAFELHYTNEDKEDRFTFVHPANMITLYSDDIEQKMIGAIRYYKYRKPVGSSYTEYYHAELYTSTEVIVFESQYAEDTTAIKETIKHYYGDVPVIEYINNEERQGDYETLINMIDAYELIVADSANEINYMNDAYLLLKNYTATEDSDIADMKNNRIILIDEDGDAQWLTKNVNDKHYMNIIDRLDEDIHKFSNVPNMSDESFGDASGTALRYRLYGLESDTSMKERKFTTGLERRAMLITNYYNFKDGTSYDYQELVPVYTRNIPVNEKENAEIANMLSTLVSKETLLSQLPIVENVEEELARISEEENDRLDYNFTLDEEETKEDEE